MNFLNDLAGIEKIFWYIAIPSSIAFLFQTIFIFIGGDSEVESDADLDNGFNMFTLKNLITFLTVFSWSGITYLDFNISKELSIFLAALSGTVMVIVLTSIFHFMEKLNHTVEKDMSTLIGDTVSCYLNIPPFGIGKGKVIVILNGTRTELSAISSSSETEDIKTKERVKIVSIIDSNTVLVERVKVEETIKH